MYSSFVCFFFFFIIIIIYLFIFSSFILEEKQNIQLRLCNDDLGLSKVHCFSVDLRTF